MWRYIRNYVVGLFTLCQCYHQLDTMNTNNTNTNTNDNTNSMNVNSIQEKLLDNVSMYIVNNIIHYIQHITLLRKPHTMLNTNVRITFEDFAAWYSGISTDSSNTTDSRSYYYGYELCSWLELLDVNKWMKFLA